MALCGESDCPLKAGLMGGNESVEIVWPTLPCIIVLIQQDRRVFEARILKVVPQHFNQIQVWTLTRLLQNHF